ncbi:MAG: hypothetical protein ACI837_001061 [Crocinitomicaceae bacterium]|jgi:hypothetical protein
MKTRTALLLVFFSLFAFFNHAQDSYTEKTDSKLILEQVSSSKELDVSVEALNDLLNIVIGREYLSPAQLEHEILEADMLFANHEYRKAWVLYKKLVTKTDNVYCRKMADESRTSQGCGSCHGGQYKKLIQVADKLYSECTLDKALELYQRAASIRPSDVHAKQRLSEIKFSILQERNL